SPTPVRLDVPASPVPYHDKVKLAVFSPDSKTLATVPDSGKQQVQLWDLASGKQSDSLPVTGVTALACSPAGKVVALATGAEGKDEAMVRLWDPDGGKELWKLPTRKGSVRPPLVFAPDGKTLLMEDPKGDLVQADVATGQLLRTLGTAPRK